MAATAGETRPKTIVVLGAAYAGLSVAHKLLKKTLNTATDYKLVLVAPNTHHYWNVAAVRAVVPGQLSNDRIIADIRPAFKQYPADKFTHIFGKATKLSPETKTVSIETAENGNIEQKYDILIIATGARSASAGPWKTPVSLKGSYEELIQSLKETQDAVAKAKTIIVGGGGPTGIETAGEIAFEYGRKKEITLITAASKLISPIVPDSTSKAAANELKKLHVNVVYDTKVVGSQKLPSGQYEVTLSTGEKKVVDLYLATLGLISNTEFVPKELLNEKGEVKVDEFLKVKGVKDIWAAGDAADVQANQLAYAQPQAAHLWKNLDAELKGQALTPFKPFGPFIAVTIGRSKGTGHFTTWKLPSFLVWLAKGRTLFLENLKPLVDGNA